MTKPYFHLVSAVTIAMAAIQVSQAQPADNRFADIVSESSVDLSMRLRHETVEQSNSLKDAAATTLRTRVTLQTGTVSGISGLIEFDNVTKLGSKRYDSLVMDRYLGAYSVIADPAGSEVNQALLNFDIDEKQRILLGRQRILHAGQRFVGGVGWRQNEQTYDAVGYRYRSPQLDADYSYVWNVNRIFGASAKSVQLTDLKGDSHLSTITSKNEWGNVSAFAYLLDFDKAPSLSTMTLGLSYSGKLGPLAVTGSIARQSDTAQNPVSYDANFLAFDGAYQAGPVKLLAGYELLGSDNGKKAFSTPLATLHKFQGWADMFLTTPEDGIEDLYVTASGKIANLSLSATFHNFKAAEGDRDYGNEWDLIAGYPINENFNLELKYATYSEEGFKVDTDKLWLSLIVAF